ncbi:MAG: hypothetical protein V4496_00430 [Pseudomonadota bacterium]
MLHSESSSYELKLGIFRPIHEYFKQQYDRQSYPLGFDPSSDVRECAQHFWEVLRQYIAAVPYPKSEINTSLKEYNDLFQNLYLNNILTIETVNRYLSELFNKIITLRSAERGFYLWFIGRMGLPSFLINNTLSAQQLSAIPTSFLSEAQGVIAARCSQGGAFSSGQNRRTVLCSYAAADNDDYTNHPFAKLGR